MSDDWEGFEARDRRLMREADARQRADLVARTVLHLVKGGAYADLTQEQKTVVKRMRPATWAQLKRYTLDALEPFR